MEGVSNYPKTAGCPAGAAIIDQTAEPLFVTGWAASAIVETNIAARFEMGATSANLRLVAGGKAVESVLTAFVLGGTASVRATVDLVINFAKWDETSSVAGPASAFSVPQSART